MNNEITYKFGFNSLLLSELSGETELKNETMIHIRLIQRTTRRSLTIIEGLYGETDWNDKKSEKIVKIMRKKFNCSVTLKKAEKIIQLQGNHCDDVKKYLIENNIGDVKRIRIHGSL